MQQDKDLKRLDGLIAEVGPRNGGPSDLLLEHLQAARRNLLGSMVGEYNLSLKEAEESLACISGRSARTELKKTLRSLQESRAPRRA